MPAVAPFLELKDLNLPAEPRVLDFCVYEFVDPVGDPALRISVTLPGDPDGEGLPSEQLRPIQDEIFRVLRARGEQRFPYIQFLFAQEVRRA